MANEDAEKFRAAALKALEQLHALVAEGNAILKELKAARAKVTEDDDDD